MPATSDEPVLSSAAAQLRRRSARRAIVVSVVRATFILGATLGVYAVVPVSDSSADELLVVAGAGVVGLAVLFIRALSRVSRADNPLRAALEALLLVFGLFLSLCALIYVAMSESDPQAFSEPLGKVAGMYFSITVLSTVGFGDITPASDGARIAVSLQMVIDLLLIGSAVKLLGFSARRGVRARTHRTKHQHGEAEAGQPGGHRDGQPDG